MDVAQLTRLTKAFFDEVKTAAKHLSAASSSNVNNQEERVQYEQLAEKWFSDFAKVLPSYGISLEILEKYSNAFKVILKLSSGKNRRESFKKQFSMIISSFNDDIIIFLQTEAEEPVVENHAEFEKEANELLLKIPDKDENAYLKEALGCWQSGFLKGATVLLWCAAIDRIHSVIEQIGFEKFNRMSSQMKAQTTGKFKHFNKEYQIQSVSDLRIVFDRDILQIIEGMQLIDSNERTRLASCFDMRCHSGHPGDAPITKYNVLSCFSDIVEIILANPKFSISRRE